MTAATSYAYNLAAVAQHPEATPEAGHARPRSRAAELLLAVVIVAPGAARADGANEQSFLAENMGAMERMMGAMHVTASGNVDRDFVAMMIPHHQGAIDMARAELLYGHNERLRRMAQEIVVTQQEEIAAMRLAVGEAPSSAAATAPSYAAHAPQKP